MKVTMSTTRLIAATAGALALSAAGALAHAAQGRVEEARAAQADARAKARADTVEAQAEAVRAQVEAAVQRVMPLVVPAFEGDFEYARAINALDRGLYEEALAQLTKLRAQRAATAKDRDKLRAHGQALHDAKRRLDEAKRRLDAITYWQAYAQHKLGRVTEALTTLSRMSEQWPASAWRNDARALEIEIRQSSGQPVRPETIEDEELKLLALQGLLRAGRPEALPALERILFSVGSPRVKERAMFVLAQHPSPEARKVMAKVIKGGANPDVQVAAVRYLAALGPASDDLLVDAYRSTADRRVKEVVVSRLAAQRNAVALVSLARGEQEHALKQRIVQHLATMKSKEATDYLVEIVNK